MEACKPLKEYAWIVDQIRNSKGDIEQVIDKAISDMPEDFEIKPFLMAHRAEVKGMLLTEYNEAATMELFREEGREEGKQEGIMQTLIRLAKRGILSKEDAAQEANRHSGRGRAEALSPRYPRQKH